MASRSIPLCSNCRGSHVASACPLPCSGCSVQGHGAQKCPNKTPPKPRLCSTCHQPGHFSTKCPSAVTIASPAVKVRLCSHCREPGDFASNCPKGSAPKILAPKCVLCNGSHKNGIIYCVFYDLLHFIFPFYFALYFWNEILSPNVHMSFLRLYYFK
jgi:hypothetical protein